METETQEIGPDARLTQAKEAYKRGDLIVARDLFESLARVGSKQAFLGLASIYERGGPGVPQDFAAARHWYGRAFSEANLVMAALELGKLHYFGLGGAVDYEKAHFYYEKLERGRSAVALLRLGIMAETGRGTPRNAERARALYKRAAGLKNIYARKNWGVMEVKRGNPMGLVLWISALMQGMLISLTRPNDERLRMY